MSIPDYTVVHGVDVGDLAKSVARAQREGYELQGGVTTSGIDGKLYQAMVRPSPAPNGERKLQEPDSMASTWAPPRLKEPARRK